MEEFQEGDLVTVAEDVTVGDVVFFERIDLCAVVARVMTQDHLSSHSGRLYVLTDLSESGSARFQEVSREDLESP